jgi:hypothetical protein
VRERLGAQLGAQGTDDCIGIVTDRHGQHERAHAVGVTIDRRVADQAVVQCQLHLPVAAAVAQRIVGDDQQLDQVQALVAGIVQQHQVENIRVIAIDQVAGLRSQLGGTGAGAYLQGILVELVAQFFKVARDIELDPVGQVDLIVIHTALLCVGVEPQQ